MSPAPRLCSEWPTSSRARHAAAGHGTCWRRVNTGRRYEGELELPRWEQPWIRQRSGAMARSSPSPRRPSCLPYIVRARRPYSIVPLCVLVRGLSHSVSVVHSLAYDWRSPIRAARRGCRQMSRGRLATSVRRDERFVSNTRRAGRGRGSLVSY